MEFYLRIDFLKKQSKRTINMSIVEIQTEIARKSEKKKIDGIAIKWKKEKSTLGFRFNLLLMVDVTNSISLRKITQILSTFRLNPKFNCDTYCHSLKHNISWSIKCCRGATIIVKSKSGSCKLLTLAFSFCLFSEFSTPQ